MLAACGPHAASPGLDAKTSDSALGDVSSHDVLDQDGEGIPYRHTIAIDGNDDFTAGEMFPTTSATYVARVTWDDDNLYVGYSGADLDPAAPDTGSKWLFVYFDVLPSGGETQSQMYNTQRATFPSGFAAEGYARYKADGTLTSLEVANSGTWMTVQPTPTAAHSGSFVELAIPRSAFGGASSIGLVSWMINEKPLAEGSYAGLYADNFTDGYAPNLALTKYLHVDFNSTLPPNDPSNKRP